MKYTKIKIEFKIMGDCFFIFYLFLGGLIFYFLFIFGWIDRETQGRPKYFEIQLVTSGSRERKDYTRTGSALRNTFPKLPQRFRNKTGRQQVFSV
jgi:hypothetical protein